VDGKIALPSPRMQALASGCIGVITVRDNVSRRAAMRNRRTASNCAQTAVGNEIGTDVDTHEGYHVNHIALVRPKGGAAKTSNELKAAITLARNASGGARECVWSMPAEKLDSLSPTTFGEGILVLEMSRWSDIQSLRRHVSQVYEHLLPVRHELEAPITDPSSVLWWSEKDEEMYMEPEIAKEKLTLLSMSGPCEEAFTFSRYSPPPSVPKIHPSVIPPGLAISVKSS